MKGQLELGKTPNGFEKEDIPYLFLGRSKSPKFISKNFTWTALW